MKWALIYLDERSWIIEIDGDYYYDRYFKSTIKSTFKPVYYSKTNTVAIIPKHRFLKKWNNEENMLKDMFVDLL